MPIENDTADGTRGPAPVPGNPGRPLRQTLAREETVKNRRDEMHKKEEKLEKLLNKANKRPADERMIDNLRKELNHYTSSDAKQSDHAQAVPVAGGEVPDIERAKKNAPHSLNQGTLKSGAEDNEREPNLPAHTESSTSSSAKQGTDAGSPQGKTRAAIQSITFQHMKDEGVDIVEEGYLQLGPRIWMVRGYGFPHGAKYEMEAIQCDSDWQRLDELPRLSSTEKRLSILKNENGRRQYTIDNIERIDAVTVLPYGRRKGKRRNHDNETKPKKPRFRLTLVQVKWKNILEEHVKKFKEGRTWEPRSELLGMVGRKCQAQLDRDIFEMCRTQDKRNASWLKEKKLSHLERPDTPLPGKVEWISGREESRKEAARIRTARQKSPKAKRSELDPQRANRERTGKMHKERKGKEKHIPPSKRSTGTDNDPGPLRNQRYQASQRIQSSPRRKMKTSLVMNPI
ncbi:hypothetical protein N7499_003521 [Penicillium canescens]|nr:hypothetical protein N7499_003521 [Penicillium canescens]